MTEGFIVGGIVQWGLGLGLPLLLRFVFLRRPVSKVTAFLTALLVWFVVFSAFYALFMAAGQIETFTQRAHGGIGLVSFISYFIMRSGVTRPLAGLHEGVMARSDMDQTTDETKEPQPNNTFSQIPGVSSSPVTTGFLNVNVDWLFNWIPRLIKKIYYRFRYVFAAIALVASLGGVYWLLVPHTYEDCILKNLKGSKSDLAVREIRSACRKKHR
jgi:hypothetical protein